MQTRVVIMAGGQESRWRGYLGTHKHLAQLDGERLIDRTVRLIHERIDADIHIVAFYPEYEVAGTTRVQPIPLDQQNELTGGTVSSAPHWSPLGRTVVLFGDVYFTDAALDTICHFNGRRCTFFGRNRVSALTGAGRNIFGFTLLPEHIAVLREAIEVMKAACARGDTNRCKAWEVYGYLHDIPPKSRMVAGDFVDIDDWTEDIDTADDYERLKDRLSRQNAWWRTWWAVSLWLSPSIRALLRTCRRPIRATLRKLTTDR